MTDTFWVATDREVVRVSGPDALTYLQGQVSQDLLPMAIGDRRWTFVLRPTGEIPFPVICAGSATQDNRTTYYEYTIDDARLTGVRRVYEPKVGTFQDADAIQLDLVRDP